MRRRTIVTAGVAGLIGVTMLAGGAAAVARAVDDEDTSVTGPEADQAATAAVDAAGGGGQATAIERDNEGSAVWEIEVTRPDGTLAEVRVDAANQVVVVNEEREGNEGSDDGDRPDNDPDDDADNDADDTEDGDRD